MVRYAMMDTFQYERERLNNWLFKHYFTEDLVQAGSGEMNLPTGFVATRETPQPCIHAINLSVGSKEVDYVARLVWDTLFHLVLAEHDPDDPFPCLHDFLCDLKLFERLLRERKTFYWEWNDGITNVQDYRFGGGCCQIEWQGDKVLITELEPLAPIEI